MTVVPSTAVEAPYTTVAGGPWLRQPARFILWRPRTGGSVADVVSQAGLSRAAHRSQGARARSKLFDTQRAGNMLLLVPNQSAGVSPANLDPEPLFQV